MYDSARIAVVIPSYRVAGTIRQVIASLPEFVDHVIVVDDACPEGSGRVAQVVERENVTVLSHMENQGVGGAMATGYRHALALECDVVVKVDGDGQMDPAHLPELIKPLLRDEADYAKGNRFVDFRALRGMPRIRLVGNNFLSFLEKLFSGYWHIMDPTNGYTAIHRRVLSKLELDKIAKGYFFESHMLLHLYLVNAVVCDISIPARYGEENSSLSIGRTLLEFPPRLLYGLAKRIVLKYFIYEFNMASVYLLLGIPLLLWGIGFGVSEWIGSYLSQEPRTAGTVMVAALPLVLSVEMLLQAINIDLRNVPTKSRSPQW